MVSQVIVTNSNCFNYVKSSLLLKQLAQSSARSVLFVQLPIPPAGPAPIYGNVPLAAGYLILHARSRGLEEHFRFEIHSANPPLSKADRQPGRCLVPISARHSQCRGRANAVAGDDSRLRFQVQVLLLS